jgi:hypothetical protein
LDEGVQPARDFPPFPLDYWGPKLNPKTEIKSRHAQGARPSGRFDPKTEIGNDGALRRHRAVQARNTFGKPEHRGSICSARCTRAGTAQRAFPTTKS